jgi:lactate dehydrogenase-like 2-hydroxyacid dehydrogenase
MSFSALTVALASESHPELRAALEAEFRVVRLDDDPAGVRGLVVTSSQGISNARLQHYPDLEVIATLGVGLDRLDLAFIDKLGVRVANTPGVLDATVAEHAMALLLAVSRRICQADEFVRQGEWGKALFPLASGLSGKRCGIAGLGRIGSLIARRCEAFGLLIAYFGRHRQADVPYEYFEDLWAMAHECDILILSLPGGKETEGIVNAEVLHALGPDGLLVSIGRGSTLDEQALLEALEYGDLGAAALDVFADEPNVPQGLRDLPNVVLTPHLGSATKECRQAMVDMLLANLRAHFTGQPMPGLVG